MAPRRFASSITLSEGTKTNSASLSTNFLISHGQATRSTLTYSRVIHFMRRLLLLWCNGLTSSLRPINEHCGAMRSWQKRIDFVPFPIEREGMRTCLSRHDFLPAHCGNIDDVYDARIADCD